MKTYNKRVNQMKNFSSIHKIIDLMYSLYMYFYINKLLQSLAIRNIINLRLSANYPFVLKGAGFPFRALYIFPTHSFLQILHSSHTISIFCFLYSKELFFLAAFLLGISCHLFHLFYLSIVYVYQNIISHYFFVVGGGLIY